MSKISTLIGYNDNLFEQYFFMKIDFSMKLRCNTDQNNLKIICNKGLQNAVNTVIKHVMYRVKRNRQSYDIKNFIYSRL